MQAIAGTKDRQPSNPLVRLDQVEATLGKKGKNISFEIQLALCPAEALG